MKQLFTVIAIIISFSVHSQNWPIDKETNKILFTDVIKVDSVSQNELFLKANEWLAKTYNDSKEVIQLNDKESGKIVSKGVFSVTVRSLGSNYPYGYVKYTLSVIVKDGRYKYELTDLYHEGGGNGYGNGGNMEDAKPDSGGLLITQKYFDGIKQQAYDQSVLLIESLNSFMTAKNISKKDNW